MVLRTWNEYEEINDTSLPFECVWLESFESEIQFLKGFKMPSIKIYCLYQIQFFFINNGDFIRVFFFVK